MNEIRTYRLVSESPESVLDGFTFVFSVGAASPKCCNSPSHMSLKGQVYVKISECEEDWTVASIVAYQCNLYECPKCRKELAIICNDGGLDHGEWDIELNDEPEACYLTRDTVKDLLI